MKEKSLDPGFGYAMNAVLWAGTIFFVVMTIALIVGIGYIVYAWSKANR